MHTALIITSEHSTRPLFGWFLKSKYLYSSQYASHPVILRGADGGVAESIISRIILVHLERGTLADDGRRPGESTFRSTHLMPDVGS